MKIKHSLTNWTVLNINVVKKISNVLKNYMLHQLVPKLTNITCTYLVSCILSEVSCCFKILNQTL